MIEWPIRTEWLSGRATLEKDRSRCGVRTPLSALGPVRRVIDRHGNWYLDAMSARASYTYDLVPLIPLGTSLEVIVTILGCLNFHFLMFIYYVYLCWIDRVTVFILDLQPTVFILNLQPAFNLLCLFIVSLCCIILLFYFILLFYLFCLFVLNKQSYCVHTGCTANCVYIRCTANRFNAGCAANCVYIGCTANCVYIRCTTGFIMLIMMMMLMMMLITFFLVPYWTPNVPLLDVLPTQVAMFICGGYMYVTVHE